MVGQGKSSIYKSRKDKIDNVAERRVDKTFVLLVSIELKLSFSFTH